MLTYHLLGFLSLWCIGSNMLPLHAYGGATIIVTWECSLTIVMLFIQDTAGSERYESMSRIYYRGAKAAIVCFGKS